MSSAHSALKSLSCGKQRDIAFRRTMAELGMASNQGRQDEKGSRLNPPSTAVQEAAIDTVGRKPLPGSPLNLLPFGTL